MITVFNRKEVCITYSMDEQARVRNLLNDAGIPYTVSTAGLQNHSQASHRNFGLGRVGERSDAMIEYKIFVKKEDYERAKHFLQQR